MKSYKVEFEEVQTYVIDVQATTEEEAKEKATALLNEKMEYNVEHYYLTGDRRLDVATVYDVTGTDDDDFINND
jgi:hypothetical protein